MREQGLPQLLLGAGIGIFLLLVVTLWYRYLGPGSVPPPPTQVQAPDDGGMSQRARVIMHAGGQ